MDSSTCIQTGSKVADFDLETYDAAAGDFGTYSLEKARADGRWTLLVFYPADFTFV